MKEVFHEILGRLKYTSHRSEGNQGALSKALGEIEIKIPSLTWWVEQCPYCPGEIAFFTTLKKK